MVPSARRVPGPGTPSARPSSKGTSAGPDMVVAGAAVDPSRHSFVLQAAGAPLTWGQCRLQLTISTLPEITRPHVLSRPKGTLDEAVLDSRESTRVVIHACVFYSLR